MTDVTLYGLKTCDSCRKARRWLEERGVSLTFQDVREAPPTAGQLETWLDRFGWARLVNTKSQTWRGMEDAEREAARSDAVAALRATPTLMKRPVVAWSGGATLGFDGAARAALEAAFPA